MRVRGVGNVNVFGVGAYGMRIWLDPDRLAELRLTASDVITAVSQQNVQAAAGQVGQPPSDPGQQLQYTVQVQGRLSHTGGVCAVIIRAPTLTDRSSGSVTFHASSSGAQTYTSILAHGWRAERADGDLSSCPTRTRSTWSRDVHAALETLASTVSARAALRHRPLDTTAFVSASIHEVVITLAIAFCRSCSWSSMCSSKAGAQRWCRRLPCRCR